VDGGRLVKADFSPDTGGDADRVEFETDILQMQNFTVIKVENDLL
jgi:hypothetical protein